MTDQHPPSLTAPPQLPLLVLDTNAVLDAWVFKNPCMVPLLQALQQQHVQWIASPAMRQELVHTLCLPLLQRWEPDALAVLAQFDRWAAMQAEPPRTTLRSLWCSDNDDQVFMDLALLQRARWLVTQDRALLRLARKARPFGVQVLPPQRWQLLPVLA